MECYSLIAVMHLLHHYAECHSAEWFCTEYHSAEWFCAEYYSAEWFCTEYHSADCDYADVIC